MRGKQPVPDVQWRAVGRIWTNYELIYEIKLYDCCKLPDTRLLKFISALLHAIIGAVYVYFFFFFF